MAGRQSQSGNKQQQQEGQMRNRAASEAHRRTPHASANLIARNLPYLISASATRSQTALQANLVYAEVAALSPKHAPWSEATVW